MIKYLFRFLFLIIIAIFFSCNYNSKNSATYFGGKIINPKSNYVVLYSLEEVIDTFFLNKKNKFIGEIKNPKEGLYYFKHGIENQYIYIEPKDSLMLRLNSWDFDESLVFSGRGAERNNVLIDYFIQGEKDNKMFYFYNKLNPTEFQKKTDSLLDLKLKTYNNYVNNHTEETNGYKSFLKVALTYPIYARIEKYPVAHIKYSKEKEFPKTNKDFYKHRKIVDINNDTLMYYYPYSKYISNFLYNTTYSLGHKPMDNEYSSKFTIDLLNTTSNKINSSVSRDAILKQTVLEHFYKRSNCDLYDDVFNEFFKLSENEQDKEHLTKLLNDSKSVLKNEKIVDFVITDFNKKEHSIKNIIRGKNSFLFFWNPEYSSPIYISSRINYLSRKFPEVKFVIIRSGENSNKKIKKLNIKTQYYINEESKANNFLTSKMPRAIIINKKGIVTNGYASISSNKIFKQLKELAKN
ncbi:hypothetical protein [Polaribacter sargassicola]|uniref:hypothetical protein n=1 Tax=Polaribacter sargassicola TaxID=2836891 RepID=UPI001F22FDB5|nr:hypothetical protein [Polaribacter sp. DS7-9]MCG1036948.1 hypothetical protein [Polaribacter sp. DS7-9]